MYFGAPRATLGPARSAPGFGNPDLRVRVADDLRKCVAFLGYRDNTPGRGGIHCIGTGFFLSYEDHTYLVTAAHVAKILGGDPFLIRLNTKDGKSENVQVDAARWHFHPDETVDVALIAFLVPSDSKYEVNYVREALLHFERPENAEIGIGDETHTIGLFKLLSGEKRNLPVVHSGHIASMPGDERIPVKDWHRPETNKALFVEGYLVETQSLSGLSGSPVWVRPWITTNQFSDASGSKPVIIGRSHIILLGVWQGAWSGVPDEVRAVEAGQDVEVPLGMGVVVPTQRIIEILNQETVRMERKDKIAMVIHPARTQSASVSAKKVSSSPPSTDANPKHREDFNSLVDVAARKREQED